MAPLLIGLQHGLGPALGSAVLVLASVHVRAPSIDWTSGGASGTVVACFVAGLLTGLFADRWKHRHVAARGFATEQCVRLAEVERAFQFLRVSHADLEQRLAAETWSLGACLQHAEHRMAEAPSSDRLAEVVLDLLSAQASVYAASFFYLQPNGAPARFAAATLGDVPQGASRNPVVQRAIANRKVTTLRDADESGDASVLAAMPLVTKTGLLHAVVAIHAMPFLALQHDHLTRIGLLCAQLADSLDRRLAALLPPEAPKAPSLALDRLRVALPVSIKTAPPPS